jgi:hypothetical protein
LRVGRVKAIALLLALGMTAGCFWRSYGPRLAMHTDLLLAMTGKGVDLVEADRFTPENLPELYYPLERARAFAARAERRSGDDPPGSLRAFAALLEAYGAFCQVADDARRTRDGGAPRAALHEAAHAVRQRAAAVEQALVAEGRG